MRIERHNGVDMELTIEESRALSALEAEGGLTREEWEIFHAKRGNPPKMSPLSYSSARLDYQDWLKAGGQPGFCPSCSKQNRTSAVYCGACGSILPGRFMVKPERGQIVSIPKGWEASRVVEIGPEKDGARVCVIERREKLDWKSEIIWWASAVIGGVALAAAAIVIMHLIF